MTPDEAEKACLERFGPKTREAWEAVAPILRETPHILISEACRQAGASYANYQNAKRLIEGARRRAARNLGKDEDVEIEDDGAFGFSDKDLIRPGDPILLSETEKAQRREIRKETVELKREERLLRRASAEALPEADAIISPKSTPQKNGNPVPRAEERAEANKPASKAEAFRIVMEALSGLSKGDREKVLMAVEALLD